MLDAHPDLQTVDAMSSWVAFGFRAPGVRLLFGSPILDVVAVGPVDGAAAGLTGAAVASAVGIATPPDVNRRRPNAVRNAATAKIAETATSRLVVSGRSYGYRTVNDVETLPDRFPS